MIYREWQGIVWCRKLAAVVGGASLQVRTYPSLQRIVGEFSDRVVRFLRLGGFPEEDAKASASAVIKTALTTFPLRADRLRRR